MHESFIHVYKMISVEGKILDFYRNQSVNKNSSTLQEEL